MALEARCFGALGRRNAPGIALRDLKCDDPASLAAGRRLDGGVRGASLAWSVRGG